MDLTKVSGKLRQLFCGAPRLWVPFLWGWLVNRRRRVRPCVFPGAAQIVIVPFHDYYESYQFFAETISGRREIAAFTSALKRDDVIFDIGGFRGAYTMAAKARFPEVAIHVFEPVRANANRIREVVELNHFNDIEVHETAVAAGVSIRGSIDPRDGMLRNAVDANTPSVDVPACSLDSLTASGGAAPTIIKLDVDGFELEVLRGAETCLRRYRPRIWIELHPEFLKAKGVPVMEVTDLLAALGYRVTGFSDAEGPDRHIAYHVWAVHPEGCGAGGANP